MIVHFGQQVVDLREELKILAQKNTLKALSLLLYLLVNIYTQGYILVHIIY